MDFTILIPVTVILSILFTILVVKGENKKDRLYLERKNKEKEEHIYNDFVDLHSLNIYSNFGFNIKIKAPRFYSKCFYFI